MPADNSSHLLTSFKHSHTHVGTAQQSLLEKNKDFEKKNTMLWEKKSCDYISKSHKNSLINLKLGHKRMKL